MHHLSRWFFILVLWMPLSAIAISLETFLQSVQNESENLQAIDKKILAAQTEIEARDIVLGSTLDLNAENFNNNQAAVTFARRSRTRFVDLTFKQPFSTGTLLSVSGGHERSVIDNFGLRQIADWEVRLNQSLWRDSFGHATSLRHRGEKEELFSRRAALMNEKQKILIELEGFYWDYTTLLQEEQIRLKNLEVSRELLKWTQSRIKRIAAEKADLLQVQALVSGRELDLITVQNKLATLRTQLQSALPNFQVDRLQPDIDSLTKERSLYQLVDVVEKNSASPMRWDALSSEAEALKAALETKKTREELKPLFDVYMSYGQNGISDTFDTAWSQAGNNRYSGTRVGVNISVPLHRGLTSKKEKAARLEAEALQLEARNKKRSSQVGWVDLERRQKVVHAQSQEASKLADFQNQKVIEERRRYKIGRSTLFQLVTFEVEAADAAVRKFTFLSELRKTESQARLFTTSRGLQ